MTLQRFGAALALSWYLTIGFGLPLVDSLLFHHGGNVRVVHVEDVDNDCHRQECPLEAPGPPQAPATLPIDIARLGRLPTETVVASPDAEWHLVDADLIHRARAPPHLT